MFRYRFIHQILFFWILGWLFVGTQQILITIDLFNAEQKNNSFLPPGYVVVEKLKFTRFDNKNEKPAKENECLEKECKCCLNFHERSGPIRK